MITGEKKVRLTPQAILQKISEYDIFRFYMPDKNWKINQATYSPFRKENNPSFLIGNRRGFLSFIDFADTSRRGDCFHFVQLLYNLKSIDDVLKLAQDTLNKSKDIDKIVNSTGTLTVKSPSIGYNLVLPIEQAKKLPGAKESEVEKIEGPNKIKVPAITTTAPLTQFKSDQLTIIVL